MAILVSAFIPETPVAGSTSRGSSRRSSGGTALEVCHYDYEYERAPSGSLRKHESTQPLMEVSNTL